MGGLFLTLPTRPGSFLLVSALPSLTWLTLAGSAFCAERTSRLDRTRLLFYRAADASVQPIQTVAQWEHRRAAIVKGMEEIMGALPTVEKRCALEVKVEEEVDGGDHIRRLVTYSAEPGGRARAYLLIPKEAHGESARKYSAVLCLHPTNQLGHKAVVGLGDKPADAYALELVRRGLVTIAPAYPLLAGYDPELRKLGYASGTMKAIWDNIRALDFLESLPFVGKHAFGAIGHSLGGHNAIYTAAFEPRIKVVVSSCGFDSYLHYMGGDPGVWQPGKGWTQDRYMSRLAMYAGRLEEIPFDFHEIIATLAPRRLFVSAPLGDSNFRWQSVDQVIEAAKPVYRLFGVADHLQVDHPDCGHDFPEPVRKRAYRLLEENLR